jgi:AraC-like DNA-binding protein
LVLEAGDFVLLPATPGFSMSGFEPAVPVEIDPKTMPSPTEPVHHGTPGAVPDMRLLGGYFEFDAPDAGMLVSLLPALVHVRGRERMATLVRLVREETLAPAAGSDLVVGRLVEILLVEALRANQGESAPPGLLRGLADRQLAIALRKIHGDLAHPWTITDLAKASALSRSAFYERFTHAVGTTPMGYLLAWRMAVAKDLLRRHDAGISEVAEQVGYGSASAFSTAFRRHAGHAPRRFAKRQLLSI